MLLKAGDHVPVMLLIDDVGSVNVPPEQIGAIVLNVGIVSMFTFTVRVALVAH